MMKIGNAGLELIKEFEGCRLSSYLCPAGIPTIGYGHTAGVYIGQTITQEQAEDLLRQDLAFFELGVAKLVTVLLNQNQFDALVSFSFNLGLRNLENSTLLALINDGQYKLAADQFSRWNKARGKVLPGLVRRRKAEADLFKKAR